ncbi:unnamed protein product [Urochloa decumbens]|uniref:DUF6598 domain-containing protein n=1 Tax=Urochloa decumbens TaxID=240449 RepID=A0ABC8VBI0_9POAL
MTAAAELAASIEANVERCPEVKDEEFSGMSEAERAAEAEKQRQEVLERAREMEQRAREERLPSVAQQMARKALWHRGRARILDFDPKQGGIYYNRCYYVDLATFDLDEESPLGPSRFSELHTKAKLYSLCESINIFSLKIVSSDVGFPIHVYGTLITRDCLDKKCVYLFRRDRDNCQFIGSEVKDHGGQDRQLSKGSYISMALHAEAWKIVRLKVNRLLPGSVQWI